MLSGGDEGGRLAALRSYAVLDTPPERAFDELARLAAFVCGTASAVITFVDETRQWFKARHNFATAETARQISFCTHTVEGKRVVVVPDTHRDPRFAENPLVTADPKIRFYAGVPLLTASGTAVGTLAVIDYVPRDLDDARLDALVALGHQVVAQLELRRQQRENLERFELVARATNDAVYDWDFVSNEIWWNQGMRTLFGYLPENVPTIHTWTQFLHPDDAERVTGTLFGVIESGEQYWQESYRFLRADGSYADILDRGYVLRDEMGKGLRMIGAMLDISERRKLEDQLRQSQKMEALGQLSGGIAHDFNNLLTVIQVNAAMLARAAKDPATREHTGAIAEATDRAAALTRQLLMVSRKQLMQQRVISVNDVVTNLSRMLHRILGEHITLVAQPERHMPPVSADIGMLEQVLLNLVVNARDAMPRGGQLTIVTGVTTLTDARVQQGLELAPGPYVWVSVSDTGTGIAAENMPHIFEPFFTTKDVGQGTGLGLATAYGIIRQHRGWFEVSSEAGRGATFKFFIPATDRTPETRLAHDLDDDLPTGTETILVVEDELALRNLVVQLLETCGYTVLPASSGVAALEVWKQHHASIQMLLTDIVMPGGLNGRELAERLRAEAPSLRVVYTSGYSPELTGAGEPLVEGVNFLQKPYQPMKLARTVRNCLDRVARPG